MTDTFTSLTPALGYKAEILADSISPGGVRLITMKTRYPRFLHPEMLRHRVFSHSVASNRAIPTEDLIRQVRQDPFVPAEFCHRVKGMGVGAALDDDDAAYCEEQWRRAATAAAVTAERLMEAGVDKSRANRPMEPYQWVHDIISATEWKNFFALRDHPAAQPEFQILARVMRLAMEASEPEALGNGEWHLPLLQASDSNAGLETQKLLCVSRCARVSYDRTDDEDRMKTLERASRLRDAGHLSPFEHIATPAWGAGNGFVGNFRGWHQMRKHIAWEHRFDVLSGAVPQPCG